MSAIPKKSNGSSSQVADLFQGKRTTRQELDATYTEEIVIALCGPIGSPLHEVSDAVCEMLKETFAYDCRKMRLSSYIEKVATDLKLEISQGSPAERINSLIDAGNRIRDEYGAGVLVELAINEIRLDREREKKQGDRFSPRRVAHIIDSIKNQEELDVLKTVYREMLYVIGVFSPLTLREQNLKRRGLEPKEIYALIDRDSGEEQKTGQTVRDTFPQSDFFLRIDNGSDAQLRNKVERFLHLILGTRIITPTQAETAMYAAASAAGNSACLSRQVGAAVTDEAGEILATGWNDVPRAGGGLYLADTSGLGVAERDMRCWNREGGKCFNDEEKKLLAESLIETLSPLLGERKKEAIELVLSKTKVRGLIEFSRSIHAEMHAILSAGRLAGHRLQGGKLYVTTYPCHSCARHIVAAGIMEVYYIEPYRKSLATRLHDDAITETETETSKVRILGYEGVAPGKYFSVFKMAPDSRKNKAGKLIRIHAREATPRLDRTLEALPSLEALVIKSLRSKNLVPSPPDGSDDSTAA